MRLAVAPAAFALPTAALASPSAQQATRLASYCSPSSDVCYGLIKGAAGEPGIVRVTWKLASGPLGPALRFRFR